MLLFVYRQIKIELKTKKLLAKTLVWLVAEIVLNFVQVDDLADYSEFVFERDRESVVLLG